VQGFNSGSPGPTPFPLWAKWALVSGMVLMGLLFFGNTILRARVRDKTRELTQELNHRIQTEKALRASHERFLTVMNSIDANIYVADLETHEILFMNRYMIESFGKDYSGDICWKAFRGESKPCPTCINSRLIDQEGNPTGLLSWQDINSLTGKWYNNYDRAIEWTDGRMVKLQTATDITYLKQMEERLRQVHKMESMGTLAGGVAHDFNNILAGILGYAQLVEMYRGEPGKVKNFIEQVIKAANRASGLVQQILTFSRHSEYQKQPLNLFNLVKEVLSLVRASLPSTIEIRENLVSKATIMGDPTQIHQVIMNLCTNASHAMGDTPGVLTVALNNIEISESKKVAGFSMDKGKYVELEIRDTGHGMADTVLERIFDPYFTTKGIGKGTGMGLAVVYGIVKTHQGLIKAESDVGSGSSFRVFFPIPDQEVSAPLPEKKHPAGSPGSERIMLVDDERDILDTLKAILEKQGYKVTAFEDSPSALETFAGDPGSFDLIITDMTMPRMAGDEFATQVLKIRNAMPIILCTGFHERFNEAAALKMGLCKYVQKPISGMELAGLIRDVLDKTRQKK
jgi:signal transduction histidine kinase/CheY-like chemotaxis protein